jgi:CDP-glucose 4,6-dehydratase
MGGYDPYSNSKGCAELVTSAYRNSFLQGQSIAVASARAGNVIGGGDWAVDRLLPDILSAFEQSRPVMIRNPLAIRPWQHVLEPLRGYLTLVEHLYTDVIAYSEGWNFGPKDDDAQTVQWIVERMVSVWGNDSSWQLDNGGRPHEANYLKLDISKAQSRLNWRPVIGLKEALSLIIDWSKQRLAGANIHQLTMDQLRTYQALTNSTFIRN